MCQPKWFCMTSKNMDTASTNYPDKKIPVNIIQGFCPGMGICHESTWMCEATCMNLWDIKKKPRQHKLSGFLVLKPGSVLLSHGETPNYHRRKSVSLPSSRWDRVVPLRYGRQANWLKYRRISSKSVFRI